MAHYDVRGPDVPRDLFPAGRVKLSTGRGITKTEHRRRRAELAKLRVWGAWDLLAAVRDGALHVERVARRVREIGEPAIAELREALEASRLGDVPTLRAEADRYLEWYARDRKPKSHRQITSRLKRFLEQPQPNDGGRTLAETRLDQLRIGDVESALAGVGGADSTKEAARLAISGLFTWSTREEAERARTEGGQPRWSINPAAKVRRRERGKRIVTATEDQALSLLAACEVYQAAYVRPFLHLGLRLGELIHTRLHDDLDLRDWRWRIQKRPPDRRCSCSDCSGEHGWSPKSKLSTRTIRVPEGPVRAAILQYLELYPCEPGDFVFRNPRTGRVWYDGTLQTDFEALCARAQVRHGTKTPGGITIHALRHTCATEKIRAGVGLAELAALLGDTVGTVVKSYVHLTEDDVYRAAQQGPEYQL